MVKVKIIVGQIWAKLHNTPGNAVTKIVVCLIFNILLCYGCKEIELIVEKMYAIMDKSNLKSHNLTLMFQLRVLISLIYLCIIFPYKSLLP